MVSAHAKNPFPIVRLHWKSYWKRFHRNSAGFYWKNRVSVNLIGCKEVCPRWGGVRDADVRLVRFLLYNNQTMTPLLSLLLSPDRNIA